MDHAAALASLRDVILPAAPPFWPPAAGWWLAALALAGLAAGGIWLARRKSQSRLCAAVTAQVDQISNQAAPEAVRELSVLMRKVALTAFPRSQVAALTQDDWLAFLDRSGQTDQFTQGVGRSLAEAPYVQQPQVDIEALIQLCRDWMQTVMRDKPS